MSPVRIASATPSRTRGFWTLAGGVPLHPRLCGRNDQQEFDGYRDTKFDGGQKLGAADPDAVEPL